MTQCIKGVSIHERILNIENVGNPYDNFKNTHLALYAVMDSIVNQYFPLVEALEEGLQQIEEKVFKEKPTGQNTEDIYQ